MKFECELPLAQFQPKKLHSSVLVAFEIRSIFEVLKQMVTISWADLLPPRSALAGGWPRTTRTSRMARTSSRLSASSAPFEAYLPFVGGRPGSAEDELKLESKFRLKISLRRNMKLLLGVSPQEHPGPASAAAWQQTRRALTPGRRNAQESRGRGAQVRLREHELPRPLRADPS